MSEEIFFTSDTHWRHKKIIEYSDRPFNSVEEMDAELIRRWNSRVGPKDTVYHIGDVAFARPKEIEKIIASLNGRIRLVRGNHDYKIKGGLAKSFQWVKDYYELRVGKIKVILFHYPIENWNKKHHGSFHIHGHSHGKTPSPGIRRMDAGVDTNDFYPYNFSEVEEIMRRVPEPEPKRR